MSEQFDSFKKEVEEDLNRERMQKMWEQYGTYIIGAAAAFVLAVAGWKYMENRRIAAAEANSVKYVNALRALTDNKTADAQTALASLAAQPGGYGLLAKLRLAGSQAASGETDKALAGYEAIARDASVDKVIADYARVQAALLKVDSAEWTDIKTRLIDIAVDTNPWKHAAQEAMGFSAYRSGNMAEARATFEKLVADATTPTAIKERASVVMAAIVQAELTKAAPAPAAPSTGPAPAPTKAAPETPGTQKK